MGLGLVEIAGMSAEEKRVRRQANLESILATLEPVKRAAWETTPSRWRFPHAKALVGQLSPRAAIKLKCESCVNYEEIELRVGGCTAYRCPLWAIRPYQEAHEAQ